MIDSRMWPETREIVRLIRRSNRCTALGPGVRAVLWVQGCPLRCPGCVALETLPFSGGNAVEVKTLADEVTLLPEIQGLTFSGGEPMSQASALGNLVDIIRARRDLSVVCYTGFPIAYLRRWGTAAQLALIDRVDILIDGPYIRGRHTDLRWRGSDNQQVHFLTPRYQHLAHIVNDRGAWIEFEMTDHEELHWMGIPPLGFRAAFEQQMQRIGLPMNKAVIDHE